MSYPEHYAAHLRLTLLRLLQAVPSRKLNDSILRDGAEQLGIDATRDQVRGELSWLADQKLVTSEPVSSLTIVTLTERGEDVALGRAVYPGVRRPSAGG